jgi:hypothetical protein
MASSELFVAELPFKEGVIYYQVSGNTKGTVRAYFRDFGNEIAIYENLHSAIMQGKDGIKRVKLIKNDKLTNIDLNKNIATQKRSLRSMLLDIFSNLDKSSKESVLEAPSDEVIGIACQMINLDGVKECKSGSLYLRRDTQIFGYNSHIVATKIVKRDLNKSYFKIPSNIQLFQKEEDWQSAKDIIESMIE